MKRFHKHYIITRTGVVANIETGREIKTQKWEDGYNYVVVDKKKFYIHRLVADAFIKKSKGDFEVNHKDFNKSNNNVSNLEWVTSSSNKRHYYMTHERVNNPMTMQMMFDLRKDILSRSEKGISLCKKYNISYRKFMTIKHNVYKRELEKLMSE